ncbi:hypothetical protein J7W19_29285 [Streptomyces mobaraensis NBRC 13819 = DSM 40847]|uniref:Uncharacterized protein n=1 Tax=Streptomyces mobaraensis (strain ATCC 29032 / DSM 40847 / JCM 4168 / NBRC 13819 / NCIMB 11159 / IPCR 16-22) TaxID=1223523 RepID=M3CEC6_STRM1|nr:hypothetical protein [Streptomyces mobaraensis]EMF02417.1 hypothetical protein H340_01184 [Streptomyces mobaraensis NBRC 13819 = DSM 40847]QTT76932.1 hypothetical protein J7W19_29285 [Streptomyces mobaraensis NBRC 13819 = DSM 40847]
MTHAEITADEWDKLYAAAIKAGLIVAKKYPGSIEADDITQGIMERFSECEGAARKLLDSGDAAGDRTIFKALLIMANQVASAEINRHRQFHGNFSYTTDHVRKLLAAGLLVGQEEGNMFDAQLNALATGRRSKKDFTTRVNVDDKIDLERGFTQLNPEQRRILTHRYVHGETLADAKDRVYLGRAIEALTIRMNGSAATSQAEHDGPGSRRAVANASARAITGNSYDG